MPADDPMIPVDVPIPEEPAPPPNVENEFLLPAMDKVKDAHIQPEGVPSEDNAPVYAEPPVVADMPMDPQDLTYLSLSSPWLTQPSIHN